MNESPKTMKQAQASPAPAPASVRAASASSASSASSAGSAIGTSAAVSTAAGAQVSRGVLLEARGVYRSFGQTPALQGADLAVGAGEILAVMGPSGSGKSTLLHCLAGIYTPDAGQVIFDGRRIDTLSDAERTVVRRTRFGFVFQFGQLVPELTTADNVALPLLLSGAKRKEAYQKAASWLDRLGLADLGARRTGELSGGQAQRVAIARALAPRPRVVFADEPTGSLDSLTGERVMDLLIETARQEDATVVIVTHDARVAAYAERMVMVRDGKVTTPAGSASEVVR
jgi:putative ABC transport system ATP-binding protein